MSKQLSIILSDKLLKSAKSFAEKRGFDSVQDFIREVLREKLFDSGFNTYLASEKSLAKAWSSKEEERAWAHLQKGM